jgi:hypothetical protein
LIEIRGFLEVLEREGETSGMMRSAQGGQFHFDKGLLKNNPTEAGQNWYSGLGQI